MEKVWNPAGKGMESIWKKYGKGMESMWKNHGIHPPFHGIHLEFLQSIPPSMDSTWNNPGRVKYCMNPPRWDCCGTSKETQPRYLAGLNHAWNWTVIHIKFQHVGYPQFIWIYDTGPSGAFPHRRDHFLSPYELAPPEK